MNRKPFAAEWELLWQAGACDLPEMADAYVALSHGLDATHEDQRHRFNRFDSHLEGCKGTDIVLTGMPGPVYPKFVALRDEFQSIMARTADNLRATGNALRQAAIAYSRTDADTANDLSDATTEVSHGYKRNPNEFSDKAPKYP